MNELLATLLDAHAAAPDDRATLAALVDALQDAGWQTGDVLAAFLAGKLSQAALAAWLKCVASTDEQRKAASFVKQRRVEASKVGRQLAAERHQQGHQMTLEALRHRYTWAVRQCLAGKFAYDDVRREVAEAQSQVRKDIAAAVELYFGIAGGAAYQQFAAWRDVKQAKRDAEDAERLAAYWASPPTTKSLPTSTTDWTKR